MNLAQLIKKLFEKTTSKILEYVNKELEGQEKKAEVDAAINVWLTDNIAGLGVVQKFIVTQYLVPTIPIVTQAIYNCLKQKIEGLTV